MRASLVALASVAVVALPFVVSSQTSCTALSLGSSGLSVTALQNILHAAYQNFPTPTGYFGSLTQNAVQQWQKEHGIVSSGTLATTGWGRVGPRTALAMGLCEDATTSSASAAKIAALNEQLAQLTKLLNQLLAVRPAVIPTGGGGTTPAATTPTTPTPAPNPTPTPTPPAPPPSTPAASCTFNGLSIVSGSSIKAYQSNGVAYGATCASEMRVCANGSLSGSASFQYASCSAGSAVSCTFNGQTIQSGSSVTAYQSSSVAYGSCTQETRTCTNGTLSGSYANASCTVTPEVDDPSPIGMATSCNTWATGADGQWSSDLAFKDCDAELAKIQSLGIKWVRLGSSWYFLEEANQPMHPDRKAFMIRLLASARARGLHILFLIGDDAPYSAYACRTHPPETVWPSVRLDFCDDAFKSYVSELIDAVAPYTHHFELFNEVNNGLKDIYPADFHYADYGAISTVDYVSGRMKVLHSLIYSIIKAKKSSTFDPIMHSTAISYGCVDGDSSGYCDDPASHIDAIQYTYWLYNGWQPSATENVLRDDIDVLDIHPYFDHSLYSSRIAQYDYAELGLLANNGNQIWKYVWATETSGGSDDAGMAAVFQDAVALTQSSYLNKFFWYVLRDSTGSSENHHYAIYDKNWNVIKPQLLQAILSATGASI